MWNAAPWPYPPKCLCAPAHPLQRPTRCRRFYHATQGFHGVSRYTTGNRGRPTGRTLQPYMEAFASDITGHASGRARIFGNFKYIDLEGDVFADDLSLSRNVRNEYSSATSWSERTNVNVERGAVAISTEMSMRPGSYTLDRGDYNFTLQDVIIKDFTIKPGSEIVFNGDPYGAQLKIQAVYSSCRKSALTGCRAAPKWWMTPPIPVRSPWWSTSYIRAYRTCSGPAGR